jgi:orotate phosphoribosyltransferase
MDHRFELLLLLHRYGYQYNEDAPFTLASGLTSPEYLDCKLALCRPEVMAHLGPLVHSKLREGVVALGGLTMGADPIAMSAAMTSASTERPVRWFSIRKTAKDHGRKNHIVGHVERNERVAIVEDVLTTGKSTVEAIVRCLEEGLDVAQVIVLVNRQNPGGLDKVQHIVGEAPVTVLYTLDEIRTLGIGYFGEP